MRTEATGNFYEKRLVVFGCGYLGAEVARAGVARGLRVTALTRNPARAAVLEAEGIRAVVADLAESAWHHQIESRPDFVLNCVSSGGTGLDGYRHSYVEGMQSLLAWLRARGPAGTLVYTSSTSVYPQDGGATVDENATPGGEERPRLLLEAERQVREGAGARDRWFILRLAGIYGPGRHHLLNQVRTGEVAGRGEYRLNLAHRDDIAAAVLACFAAPAGVRDEIFNVADDGAASKAEVVRWLAQRTGAPEPHFTGEPLAGRRTLTPDRVIANAKLKRTLGWQPRFPTYREGYETLLSR